MESRVAIAAGLGSGVLVAVLLIVVLVALGPDPSAAPVTQPPSGSPVAASPTSASPGSAAPSGGAAPSRSAVPSAGDAAFHIGEPAPPLVVPKVGGGTIDLATFRGKPVWVNFMGTYCPPCRDEFPVMNRFYTQYSDDGLVVLAIDVREDEGTVAAFAQQLNATFPMGLDGDGTAQRAWEAVVLPMHFWIDKEGTVRYGALGGIGPDIMADGLRTIMPGVDITL